MSNTIILRRRIKTAQNVSKTTRAMQMIAASKLKKAQDATLASKPYVEKLSALSKSLSERLKEEENLHPYIKPITNIDKTIFIVISPDKGLCGGLITNLLREYLKLNRKDEFIHVSIGKKMERNLLRLGKNLVASFPFGNTLPSFEQVFPISEIVNDYYLNKKVNSVKILSTEFSSVFSQYPKFTTLLPINLTEINKELIKEKKQELPIIFEPSVREILPDLLKHYLEMVIYQHLLESYLSEQAARMVSMQNATQNAKDIITELRLEYNKARQQKITSEILDITSTAFSTA